MNINSVNNHGINSVQNTASSALEKVATGLAINSASDNASSLAIASNLETQRSTLNQSLANVNSGIALTNIAQDGLNGQKKLLENIHTLSIEALSGTNSADSLNSIKSDIASNLEQFNNIAQSTQYNGTKLLSGDEKDLSIITDENENIDIHSVDTQNISDTISGFLDNFSSGSQGVNNLLNATNNGLDNLSQFTSDFASASLQSQIAGKTTLSTQTSIAQASSTLVGVDYGKAISDFSKSNIISQIGLLASTQANAIQQRNVALLS